MSQQILEIKKQTARHSIMRLYGLLLFVTARVYAQFALPAHLDLVNNAAFVTVLLLLLLEMLHSRKMARMCIDSFEREEELLKD